MTVSLALRHDPRIPVATRERILRAAKRLGYRKNPLVAAHMASLRGLHPRGREAHIIAYVEAVLAERPPQLLGSMERFRDGAKHYAESNGYRLEPFQLGEGGLSEARLLQILATRGIHGVVFAPFLQPAAGLALPWDDYALASIGYSLKRPRLHRAINHHAHSIQLAAQELRALGYRRIGLVLNGNENERTEQGWLSAFLLLRHQYPPTERTFPILLADPDKKPLQDWLRRERPDCVLSPDSGLFALLREWWPERRARPGFACLHLNASCPGFSGIDQNNERVGGAAVALVLEQLHGNNYGVPASPKTVLIEGCWIAGNTAPAVARRD